MGHTEHYSEGLPENLEYHSRNILNREEGQMLTKDDEKGIQRYLDDERFSLMRDSHAGKWQPRQREVSIVDLIKEHEKEEKKNG